MDGRMLGGEHLGSPVRSPERRGESCIRPLCSIRPYAQKLRFHRAMLYAFRRSTRNPIRAYTFNGLLVLPPETAKAISIKEYTNLLVFIVQLLRCNNSYIV
ncbi:MAG: hypothetical protein BECKG1743E_GA0114224_102424, partial [Candidatus Kentron sp. G]